MPSVILIPSCRAMRSVLSPLSFSAGTVPRARSRLSTDSTRSRAKRWIAKSFAAFVSRAVRSCRLRKSATERRYLSYEVVELAIFSARYQIALDLNGRSKSCARHTFSSMISLSFFSTSAFNFAASSFAAGAASVFCSAADAESPSFDAAGESEYHRTACGATTRVLTSGCLKICVVRGAACLEARRIVLCSIVYVYNLVQKTIREERR